MSKNKHTNPAYISHVHLKGYKSIIDTEVELHPGLNIIIGPNGSGKTNFCEFTHRLFNFKYPLIPNKFNSKVKINYNDKEFVWAIAVKHLDRESSQFAKTIEEYFFEKGAQDSKSIEYQFLDLTELTGRRNKAKTFLIKHFQPSIFIWFSSPSTQSRYNETTSLEGHINIKINKKSLELEGVILFPLHFVSNFIFRNFLDLQNKDILESADILIRKLEIDKDAIRNLRKFSPIKDIRIGKGLTVSENSLTYDIDYIRFEFLVDGFWISWNQLSDGTKRMFYIITQISAYDRGLTIIEEPEIGVHPNQHRKLLTFLKEQAEEKQIIITTHAPRTLDILKNDELNRIILTRYDKDKGTKMRHLSEEEIKQAIEYKEEEGSASELWTYTGFFDEEEVI